MNKKNGNRNALSRDNAKNDKILYLLLHTCSEFCLENLKQ